MNDEQTAVLVSVAPAVVVLLGAGLGMAAVFLLGVDNQLVTGVLMGSVMPLVGLTLFVQAGYTFANPELAVEHDIRPPSKRNREVRDESHAKRVAVMSVVAGLLLIGVGVAVGYGLLAS